MKSINYQEVIGFLDYFRDNSNENISTTSLQRRFRIGRSEAKRIMTRLENDGYVSKYDGVNPREILKGDQDE